MLWPCVADYWHAPAKVILRCAVSRYNDMQRTMAYRFYVTDSLRMLTGARERYFDMLHPDPDADKTGDELVDQFLQKYNRGEA